MIKNTEAWAWDPSEAKLNELAALLRETDLAKAAPGMLLSGLAASAGSAFWHDQLDRLRATKTVAEQVKAAVGQVQGTQSS